MRDHAVEGRAQLASAQLVARGGERCLRALERPFRLRQREAVVLHLLRRGHSRLQRLLRARELRRRVALLRPRLRLLRLRLRERVAQRRRVQPRQHLALLHGIAFTHQHRPQPARDQRPELHVHAWNRRQLSRDLHDLAHVAAARLHHLDGERSGLLGLVGLPAGGGGEEQQRRLETLTSRLLHVRERLLRAQRRVAGVSLGAGQLRLRLQHLDQRRAPQLPGVARHLHQPPRRGDNLLRKRGRARTRRVPSRAGRAQRRSRRCSAAMACAEATAACACASWMRPPFQESSGSSKARPARTPTLVLSWRSISSMETSGTGRTAAPSRAARASAASCCLSKARTSGCRAER